MPQFRRKLAGTVEINRQITQIAVVDANDLCPQCNGALQFLFITDFGQHPHLQTVSDGCKLAILVVIQY
ncbi:Uncharacterised protein [Shigella sonnei]|nr:Uncharacterised protein [Shigella sonnei]